MSEDIYALKRAMLDFLAGLNTIVKEEITRKTSLDWKQRVYTLTRDVIDTITPIPTQTEDKIEKIEKKVKRKLPTQLPSADVKSAEDQ